MSFAVNAVRALAGAQSLIDAITDRRTLQTAHICALGLALGENTTPIEHAIAWFPPTGGQAERAIEYLRAHIHDLRLQLR